MSGYLLDEGSTINCEHSGSAKPVATSLHVKVLGKAIVTQTSSYMVTGCSLMPPPPPPKPFCATATWTSGATKVKSDGAAVLLDDSQAVCATTGAGLQIVTTQTKVKGT
jgi:hypothetical protein